MQQHGYEDVMDAHYGMISTEQAMGIAAAHEDAAGKAPEANDITTCRALLAFIATNKSAGQQAYVVNVKDRVYRVFNATKRDEKSERYRTVVLGSEGYTIPIRVFGTASDHIDDSMVCRGDMLFVKGAALDIKSESLKATKGTVITKLSASAVGAVSDFSSLVDGQKSIDVKGMVVEMGQIRYVARLGDSEKVAVSDCVLSDGTKTMRVSMWGSSANATQSVRINDTVRIEFCGVRSRNGETELYANDLSRVLVLKA